MQPDTLGVSPAARMMMISWTVDDPGGRGSPGSAAAAWLETSNENPRRFVWTDTAE